jgi:tetratricopeptide (TPR) repeat protein
VAYSSLLLERRRGLHARIVETLEALSGDRVAEQVERLAHHALRSEVWDKALARSAHREAVGSFEQALSILLQLPEQRDTRAQAIDLRLALRSALYLSGDYGRILALLREAEALDDPRRLEQVSRFLSVQFYFRGAHTQAIAAAQRALDLATTSGYSALKAMANQSLGFVYHSQGDYRRAIDCFGQVIPFFEGAWHRECFGLPILSTVFPRAFLAICHAELGTFAAGRDLGEAGCRIAETADLPGSLMVASWGVGLWASRQGDLSRALPLLVCRLSLGEAQLLAGHREEAHALAQRALWRLLVSARNAGTRRCPAPPRRDCGAA